MGSTISPRLFIKSLAAIFCALALAPFLSHPVQAMDLAEAKKTVIELEQTKSAWMGVRKDHVLRRTAREYLMEAATLLERFVRGEKDPFETTFLLARTWTMLNGLGVKDSYGTALDHFARAIKLRPGDQEPRLHLALFHRDAGKMSRAVRAYWDALWLGEERPAPSLLEGMATAYLYKGSGLWAYWAARQHLEYYPLDRNVSWILERAKNQVIPESRQALEIRFTPGGVHYTQHLLKFAYTIPPGWQVMADRHDGKPPITHDAMRLAMPTGGGMEGGIIPPCALEVRVVRRENEHDAQVMAEHSVSQWRLESSEVLGQGDHWIVFEKESNGKPYRSRVESVRWGDTVCILHYRAIPPYYDEGLEELERWRRGFRHGEAYSMEEQASRPERTVLLVSDQRNRLQSTRGYPVATRLTAGVRPYR
ncbi:MAG: tetratricopeptide repeat protein [Desulfatibacillaceae bacterium]